MNNSINSTFSNNTVDKTCDSSMWDTIIVLMWLLDIFLSLPTLPWALWILVRNSALETELFIFNILCTDLISVLLTPISIITTMLNFSRSARISQAIQFLINIYLNGYPLFQCSMCFERYVAVVYPLTYLKYKVMKYKLMSLSVLWVVTLVLTVINHFYFNPHILLSVLIPVVCIGTFFSFSILKVLKRGGPGDNKRRQENDMKKKAFVIVFVLQIKLLFNYMPYILFSVFQSAFSSKAFFCGVVSFTVSACTFGHFFQAFFYLQRVKKV